jgi:hypothetical protein
MLKVKSQMLKESPRLAGDPAIAGQCKKEERNIHLFLIYFLSFKL